MTATQLAAWGLERESVMRCWEMVNRQLPRPTREGAFVRLKTHDRHGAKPAGRFKPGVA